ncbi:MAG: sugar transferase [Flavobacteriales bacterium]|nr:sugar transferase [Flavobacteriales bacterium]
MIKILPKPIYPNYIKPFFDFISAFIGFILASPIFLLCTIALAIVNKGTPFFKQIHPGKKIKKLFRFVKFKTMNEKKEVLRGNFLVKFT